eukprot:gene7698-1377_t
MHQEALGAPAVGYPNPWQWHGNSWLHMRCPVTCLLASPPYRVWPVLVHALVALAHQPSRLVCFHASPAQHGHGGHGALLHPVPFLSSAVGVGGHHALHPPIHAAAALLQSLCSTPSPWDPLISLVGITDFLHLCAHGMMTKTPPGSQCRGSFSDCNWCSVCGADGGTSGTSTASCKIQAGQAMSRPQPVQMATSISRWLDSLPSCPEFSPTSDLAQPPAVNLLEPSLQDSTLPPPAVRPHATQSQLIPTVQPPPPPLQVAITTGQPPLQTSSGPGHEAEWVGSLYGSPDGNQDGPSPPFLAGSAMQMLHSCRKAKKKKPRRRDPSPPSHKRCEGSLGSRRPALPQASKSERTAGSLPSKRQSKARNSLHARGKMELRAPPQPAKKMLSSPALHHRQQGARQCTVGESKMPKLHSLANAPIFASAAYHPGACSSPGLLSSSAFTPGRPQSHVHDMSQQGLPEPNGRSPQSPCPIHSPTNMSSHHSSPQLLSASATPATCPRHTPPKMPPGHSMRLYPCAQAPPQSSSAHSTTICSSSLRQHAPHYALPSSGYDDGNTGPISSRPATSTHVQHHLPISTRSTAGLHAPAAILQMATQGQTMPSHSGHFCTRHQQDQSA